MNNDNVVYCIGMKILNAVCIIAIAEGKRKDTILQFKVFMSIDTVIEGKSLVNILIPIISVIINSIP